MLSSFEHIGSAVPRMSRVVALSALLASSIFIDAATAAMHPNTRGGWFFGLGLGGGSAALTSGSSSSDREMGSAGSLRGGYATPNFAIGLESNIWFKTINGVDWTFGTYAVGISAFPAEGLVLRAGIGAGDAEAAASAAATGALDAAGKVGSSAAEKVRNALTGTIDGVKVVLREPFRGDDGNDRKRDA